MTKYPNSPFLLKILLHLVYEFASYNKRIKGTKPAGHEFRIWLVLRVFPKLTTVARILAPYAQGR